MTSAVRAMAATVALLVVVGRVKRQRQEPPHPGKATLVLRDRRLSREQAVVRGRLQAPKTAATAQVPPLQGLLSPMAVVLVGL